jgi:hypothetical protein
MCRIIINITREEYQKLLSYPPEKRIIGVGDNIYKVTILTEKFLKAVPYEQYNIIGRFREERDQQFHNNVEYSNNK